MVYTANWVIICYLPPIKETRKLHWWIKIMKVILGRSPMLNHTVDGWTDPFFNVCSSNWSISPGRGEKKNIWNHHLATYWLIRLQKNLPLGLWHDCDHVSSPFGRLIIIGALLKNEKIGHLQKAPSLTLRFSIHTSWNIDSRRVQPQ